VCAEIQEEEDKERYQTFSNNYKPIYGGFFALETS
jgi:hypothetical protein